WRTHRVQGRDEERFGFRHLLENIGTDKRHDAHGEHHVGTIGNFHTKLRIFGAQRTHNKGDDIHGATTHSAVERLIENSFHFSWVFPVVSKASVFFFFGTDKRPRLYAGNISGIREGRIRIRKLWVRQTNQ